MKGIGILAAAGGLFYGGVVAAESPAFDLQTVELAGDSGGKVTVGDVMSAGRLQPGQNLLKVPTDQAAGRIESLPWVSDATVERILPSRIRVTIVQRQPAFVIMAGQTPWLVDGEGVVLEQAEMGLLHLIDLPVGELEAGRTLGVPQFQHVARIVDSLPPFLRGRLHRIRAASVDRITLELTDGAAIIYGAAENIEDKNYAARRLLELHDGRGVRLETVDVRVPSRPAAKPRTES